MSFNLGVARAGRGLTQHGNAFRLAGLAALRFIAELLVMEK